MKTYTHIPTLCNELLWFVSKSTFSGILGQHQTDKRSKRFSTRNTFTALFIGQATQCDSIRHLKTTLYVHSSKMYHLWFQWFARSTFSDWINKVPPVVFQTLFYHVLWEVTQLLAQKSRQSSLWDVYAMDATLIALTLSVFNRAHYRKKKWALKLHTRMNLGSALPDLVHITDGKQTDWKEAYHLTDWLKKWSVVIFDRWYLDYEYRDKLDKQWVVFVTRTKSNTEYCATHYHNIVHPQIQYDATVEFVYWTSLEKYNKPIRVVRYLDPKSWEEYEYITNNFELSAIDIADLYKKRREIETLFRRLKQNLKIKEFFWTSQNAVENQVWVALIYYLIVVYIKEKTRCSESLLELTRKISILLFERTKLIHLLWSSPATVVKATSPPQVWLFSF